MSDVVVNGRGTDKRIRPGAIRLSVVDPLTMTLVALLALGAIACGGNGDGSGTSSSTSPVKLLVVAAADLRPALEEIAPKFKESCGCELQLSFGSSGNIATQIEQGIPADVFFAADVAYVDSLDKKGLIISSTKQLYAVGRIVLATPKNAPSPPQRLQDLTDARFARVAIANPEHAPYGVAAMQALQSQNLWEAVKPRLVMGENAAQAMQYVQTGDAQAGIVPLSLATQQQDKLNYVLIDQSLHAPLRQGAAVIKTSEHRDAAARLITFINSPTGSEVMKKYGFLPPT
jgi:molybdate transport system substrate-binding protein